jgi:8-oxo-dGTP pyrophosphatase MutT (NUDIX family)
VIPFLPFIDMAQLFLSEIAVYFTDNPELISDHTPYFEPLAKGLAVSKLELGPSHILLKANEQGFKELLKNLDQFFMIKPQNITIAMADDADYSKLIQQHFKIIYAAGGVVSRGHQILMIYRSNKWDLPKGKIELGEEAITAAIREVAEECGVEAIPIKKLGSTWHNYMQNGIHILKETTWYAMDCVQDAEMKPQESEGITQVAWLDTNELQLALSNSYASIRYVVDLYYNNFMASK